MSTIWVLVSRCVISCFWGKFYGIARWGSGEVREAVCLTFSRNKKRPIYVFVLRPPKLDSGHRRLLLKCSSSVPDVVVMREVSRGVRAGWREWGEGWSTRQSGAAPWRRRDASVRFSPQTSTRRSRRWTLASTRSVSAWLSTHSAVSVSRTHTRTHTQRASNPLTTFTSRPMLLRECGSKKLE